MEPLLPTALLGVVVFNLTNLIRFARGRDWNGVLTNLTTWVVGWVVALIAGASTVAENVVLPGFSTALGAMSAVDLILVALPLGSIAHVTNEFRGAIDNTSSTAKPLLIEQQNAQTRSAINHIGRPVADFEN